MSVFVFVGPTLRREEVAATLDAVCLPPAAQGDVYRAALGRPRAIGIIDGYFSGAPSVWHKEILWALSQGIPVFGSASMGALRAAELHGFGMRGIGRVFEAFRDDVLEDDDEVAVVHGPAEIGYGAASEAMVNMRATLARAEALGIVGSGARQALERFAKALFYPRRSWPAVLEGSHGVPPDEIAAVRAWLPSGRIDQKREDALAMLAAMRDALVQPAAAAPEFVFTWTQLWDELVVGQATEPAANAGTAEVPDARILDELRLEGMEPYGRARDQALVGLLAQREARQRGIAAAPEAMRATLTRLRAELGLYTRAALEEWLARNHLDAAGLQRLLAEEIRAQAVTALAGGALERHLLDVLKRRGDYERLAERARRKHAALAARGLADGSERPPDMLALRLWFFEERLARQVPDDMAAFARELGFIDLTEFDSALRREQVYLLQDSNSRNR